MREFCSWYYCLDIQAQNDLYYSNFPPKNKRIIYFGSGSGKVFYERKMIGGDPVERSAINMHQ
jgi:hypothetical protein